ncbi:DUF4118 domain-containing protein [bacterium]|nr:MAG: DUF4118 domain-containing protein [bacterium]
MRADSAHPGKPSEGKRLPEGRWLGSAKLPSRLSIAVATFAAVFAWRLALQPVLGPVAPYLGFLFAIVVATRMLGWFAGLVALGASVAVANYTFHPGPPGFGVPNPGAAAQLVLFVMTSLLLIGLDRSLLMSNLRLAAEADSRPASGA